MSCKKGCWNYHGPHLFVSVQVSLPHSVISLSKAEIEEPDLSSVDPVVIIMDKNTSKFSSH